MIKIDEYNLRLWLGNTIIGARHKTLVVDYNICLVNKELIFGCGTVKGVELVRIKPDSIFFGDTIKEFVNDYKKCLVEEILDNISFYNVELEEKEIKTMIETIKKNINQELRYYSISQRLYDFEIAHVCLL